ncbi:hypothetical protein EX895_003767 [Sporisorium graminicola]|uniref:Uncharacterized protein n=1 Tax=Sporisorium graminicola TaxID=280036 RepID=A0A4U7KRM6_9BASI|nr:hypothetical protein EX895_003767 [Sporisorium graminicola]TKY87090.1 hypothetical protein EX895_003767 [Sporisorium graminicola]
MTRAGRFVVRFLLLILVWTPLARASDAPARCRKPHARRHQSPPSPPPDNRASKRFQYVRKHHQHSTTAPRDTGAFDKRGVAGIAGDIEWMGFYGSLLAVPTMLSVLGIVTNYNLEKSYYNSQLNAQYYKQTREMLRAHSAKLIREQEQKFAQAGVKWQGMIYDKDGNLRPGAHAPSWHGQAIGAPPTAAQGAAQPAANTGAGAGAGNGSAAAPAGGNAASIGGDGAAAVPSDGAAAASGGVSGGGSGTAAGEGGEADAIGSGDSTGRADSESDSKGTGDGDFDSS